MKLPRVSALVTDLYQLTMFQAYLATNMTETAVFEFFVRSLPKDRNFLIAAGLAQVLDYLEDLRFEPDELQWLAETGRFRADVIDALARLRFTGDVHAMPEGTTFFPNEPILRIIAPLPEAQLVESRIINLLQFQTLVTSKAARCVLAAPGKTLLDFGMRRAHGAEAGLLAARASYLAGFAGTATVQAGQLWDIPTFGTMAHSFVQAHDNELLAFEQFAEANANDVVLLIDTYDTEAAARKLIPLAQQLRGRGIRVKAVRLDSGDLVDHAQRVRRILDEGGLHEVSIFASGNLDEHALAEIEQRNAPIDGFGIGTKLDVSSDAPYLECAYKLQEYAGKPRRKKSEGKTTWPGRKQVFRQFHPDRRLAGDTVTLESEPAPGTPLLISVMVAGQRVQPSPTLAELRSRVSNSLAQLPELLRQLTAADEPYSVTVSSTLQELAQRLDEQQLDAGPLAS